MQPFSRRTGPDAGRPMADEEIQEALLDHSRRPRCFGALSHFNHAGRGENPLCGDSFEVMLKVRGGTAEDLGFTGKGCAISTASASIMCAECRGRSLAEIRRISRAFDAMLGGSLDPAVLAGLGEARLLNGAAAFPTRIPCARAPWDALRKCLDSAGC